VVSDRSAKVHGREVLCVALAKGILPLALKSAAKETKRNAARSWQRLGENGLSNSQRKGDPTERPIEGKTNAHIGAGGKRNYRGYRWH